jgi:hypothetical protein
MFARGIEMIEMVNAIRGSVVRDKISSCHLRIYRYKARRSLVNGLLGAEERTRGDGVRPCASIAL